MKYGNKRKKWSLHVILKVNQGITLEDIKYPIFLCHLHYSTVVFVPEFEYSVMALQQPKHAQFAELIQASHQFKFNVYFSIPLQSQHNSHSILGFS